jgi:carotenoid cleavage dioxygenase-like enzyme
MFKPESALTDNGVVNVVKFGEEYLALTETPLPVAFDGDTLDTLGVTEWASEIPGLLTTAHPHGDHGELINYAAHLGPVNRYRIYTLVPGGKPRVAAEMKVRKPAYMHSFGLTERFYVLAEYPFVVDPLRLATTGKPFIENFEWQPERGTTFHLFDRASGDLRASFDAPPGFTFHFVNCFEEGEQVVADVCVYADPSIIDTLYMDGIDSRASSPPPLLTRYRLDLATGGCTTEQLADIPFELPRIDYGRLNGKPYRYTYGISSNDAADWPNVLAKVDVSDGSFALWHEPGCYPSEPVFVRDPAGTAEDDGVALSVVLDSASGRSFMLVLDASTWQERARAEAPQHVPFGFHGQFFQ